MKIRTKIILVVLPLIIVSLALAEGIIWLEVTRDINRMAEETLDFKLYELENYAQNQWSLLVENGYAGRENMVDAAKSAVGAYARTLTLNQTECIFALDTANELAMWTGTFSLPAHEREALAALTQKSEGGILRLMLNGRERVFKCVPFVPFHWQLFVSEERDVFYHAADKITEQACITLIAALLVAVTLLVLFSNFLTRPLERIVRIMRGVTASGDYSARAEVVYNDEIGALAQTFNFMLREMERSYKQTKKYAFESTLAQKKETRIREIFQKYVPQDVINQFFASPEKMLQGENRDLAILFSDIRGFTTISEHMQPDEIVGCLNRYFSGQVDSVIRGGGIVDKYIGDSLMAFWGAPAHTENDALAAVNAALDMLDDLERFNNEQETLGKPRFRIGIGINYGPATVGNIGNDRKMNYTIIGDAVNLASRVEELTKTYHEQLLITEYVYEKVQDTVSARRIDSVTVRGRAEPVNIYTVARLG